MPKIGGKIFWIKTNLHFELCGPMIVLWQESPPGRFYNTQSYSKSEQVRGGLAPRKSTLIQLSVNGLVLWVSMGRQVEEVDEVEQSKLRKAANAGKVEQGKNPQDDAGLLSFAFFW